MGKGGSLQLVGERMINKSAEVDAYIESFEPEIRDSLLVLRTLIQEVVPNTVESMRYRMPTYEYKGGPLCGFAARKKYLSLYIHTRLFEKYADELKDLDMGKECIRFKKIQELPLEIIRQILKEAVEVERA
jgi:uncharacterized protein YdhG (YjbR/CyaY superfamily)